MGTLIFFLVTCVLAGLAVLLWDRRILGEPVRLDQYECFLDHSSRFAHLSRITAPCDFEFLQSLPEGPDLARRLSRERRAVLRLILRDLRQEFRALVAVGIMLAALPTARRSSFGVRLMMSAAAFDARYCWLYGRTFRPLPFAGQPTTWLTDLVTVTRQATRSLLASLTSDDMETLRDQILGG
jgi:hypothetical protein